MAPPFPVSTQWVAIPTDLKSSVHVRWIENGGQHRTAVYYHARCFWGDLKKKLPDGTPPRALSGEAGEIDIVGSTKIYIAQEYAERLYGGGPLGNFHVRDLAKQAQKIKPDPQWVANDGVPPWVTMPLNENFHYGQEGSDGKLRRWIVYHPPAAKGMSPPGMYQHRFTGLAKTEFLQAASKDMAEVVPDNMKIPAQAASIAIEMFGSALGSKFGDPLHQFLGDAGIKLAKECLATLDTKVQMTQRDKELVALQIVELDKIVNQVNQAKKESTEAQDSTTYQREVRRWVKKNLKGLKPIYAAMVAEMEANRLAQPGDQVGHVQVPEQAQPAQVADPVVPDPPVVVAPEADLMAQQLNEQVVSVPQVNPESRRVSVMMGVVRQRASENRNRRLADLVTNPHGVQVPNVRADHNPRTSLVRDEARAPPPNRILIRRTGLVGRNTLN